MPRSIPQPAAVRSAICAIAQRKCDPALQRVSSHATLLSEGCLCYLGAICFSSGGPIKLWLALSADENRRLFCNLFDAASGLKLPLSEKKNGGTFSLSFSYCVL